MKPTDEDKSPIEDRYTLMLNALDKRTGIERGTNVGINLEEFVVKLRNLRMATIKYGSNLAESFLIENLNATFPGLEIAGRRIQSSADLVEFYKKGPNDPKMRGIIHFCTDTVWGDNNQWAINGEAHFCRRFLIKYTGIKSNGKRTNKVHKGRCVAQIFVAAKGTLMEKIRNAGKKFHFEAIYRRGEKSKIGLAGTDSKGIPRMIRQIPATVASHGFNGKLGICDGHPEAEKIKQEDQPSVVETPNSQDSQISSITMMSTPVPTGGESELMAWMTSMNFNLNTTKDDMLAALLADGAENLLEHPELLRTPERPGANTVITASTVRPPSPANDTVVTNTSPASTVRPPSPANDTVVTNTGSDEDNAPEEVSASSLYLGVYGFGTFLMISFSPMQTAAPTTPTKSPTRSPLKSPPITPSRWNCCHEPDRLTMLTHHNGYFAPKYLANNPNFPSMCSGKECGKRFVVKAKAAVAAGEYKVSTKSPVHVCCNAANSRHAFCVFAHCHDCHQKELEKVAIMTMYNQGAKRGQDETALDNDASRKSKRSRKESRKKVLSL